MSIIAESVNIIILMIAGFLTGVLVDIGMVVIPTISFISITVLMFHSMVHIQELIKFKVKVARGNRKIKA